MVFEVFVPGFVLACLGLGSFGGAIAAYLDVSFEMQLIVSALTALVAFIFLRPFALKMGFSGNERLSGVDALLGRECIVTQAFDAATGLGRCKVDGDDWREVVGKLSAKVELDFMSSIVPRKYMSTEFEVSLDTDDEVGAFVNFVIYAR